MRILFADDHELVRDTIISFVQHETGYRMDGVANLEAALLAVQDFGPYDLVLLDYEMPGMHGLGGVSQMLRQPGAGCVAILSGNMPLSMVEQAFQLGAMGYLPKTLSPASLIAAIRMILAGGQYAPVDLVMKIAAETRTVALPDLSLREGHVLRHLCLGMTNAQIARELRLHEATVKIHVKSICTKVGARNRTQASIIAHDSGFC